MQKKSSTRLILPLLLVLTLAVAGYFYLGGGLEPGALKPYLDSVLEMAGLSGGSKTKPPPPKPAPTASRSGIPARPVSGQLNGQSFRLNYSEISDGVLALIQGSPSSPTKEVRIYLFTRKGEVPAGQVYTGTRSADGIRPHIHIGWKAPGTSEPLRKSFTENYSLQLEFGKVKGDRLPGKISVQLPGAKKTQVAGTFNAAIKGFRMIDGVPDLRGDANETLVYVALTHLLRDDPELPIRDIVYKNVKYTPPKSGSKQKGSLEMIYRIGDGQFIAERFSFIKEKDGWQISGAR